MPQSVTCQSCAKKFTAKDELAGKKVRCPSCKAPIEIPALAQASLAAMMNCG